MKFIPFELEGDSEVDDIVDVRDGGDETSESFFGGRVVHDATTGLSGNTRPLVNVFIALFSENFRHLAHDDFLTVIDAGGEAEEGVNKGGCVDYVRVFY